MSQQINQSDYVETRYWHKLDDGRVQCDVCPRFCRLHENQRGLCFVRACVNQQIVLTAYGRSSGFCIDPIEKKPLNHFLPGTPVLSFGTAGCNLACKFCQNWDMSKSREMSTLASHASPSQIVKAASKTACRSVAFTYNDPVIFMEYAIDVANLCRENNIKSVAVSAAYISDSARADFFQVMDAANIDLKAFSERFYWKVTGSHLQAVLDSLIYIHKQTSVWLEITTLLIPGENDSQAELEKMCQWIVEHLDCDVPLHFTAFHPDWKMQDKPVTPIQTLLRARAIAHQAGLRYVYTGNVNDWQSQSTYCHNCKSLLIGRDRYDIFAWHLDADGQCNVCGTACAGVFTQQAGDWGNRRQRIDINSFAP